MSKNLVQKMTSVGYLLCKNCGHMEPNTWGCTTDKKSIEIVCEQCGNYMGARYTTQPLVEEDYDNSAWMQCLSNHGLYLDEMTADNTSQYLEVLVVHLSRRIDFLEQIISTLLEGGLFND